MLQKDLENFRISEVNEMNQSEYQREAMRKYMEELNTHTTKIVEKPPQTELNKPLSRELQKEIKSPKRSKSLRRSHAGILHIQSNTEKMSKKERKAQQKLKNESHSDKKQEWLCIECGTNPTWLDYSVCYTCYCKKEKANKEKKHWAGGYTPL